MKDSDINVLAEPEMTATAKALWDEDKKGFKLWALGLAGAKPVKNNEKVDGVLEFIESDKKKHKIIVQVKGGEIIVPGMIKDLLAIVEKEGAVIGLIISLYNPRLAIITDAVHAGNYESGLWKRKFLKIQIRTVNDLLAGKTYDIPQTCGPAKKVKRIKNQSESGRLL